MTLFKEMKSSDAKSRFEVLLSQRDNNETPAAIISCMLDFYRDERLDDCIIEDDGDMLLYQWGTYDWGQGRWFDFNITRQYVPGSGEDEDIFQLSVTAKYSPAHELDALGSGNKWCGSPKELPQFNEFIYNSPPLQFLHQKPCDKVDVSSNQTG